MGESTSQCNERISQNKAFLLVLTTPIISCTIVVHSYQVTSFAGHIFSQSSSSAGFPQPMIEHFPTCPTIVHPAREGYLQQACHKNCSYLLAKLSPSP